MTTYTYAAAGTDGQTITVPQSSAYPDLAAGKWNITGTTGNDTITGGADDDTIDGNGGADVISGGKGADSITVSGNSASIDAGDATIWYDGCFDGKDTVNNFNPEKDKVLLWGAGDGAAIIAQYDFQVEDGKLVIASRDETQGSLTLNGEMGADSLYKIIDGNGRETTAKIGGGEYRPDVNMFIRAEPTMTAAITEDFKIYLGNTTASDEDGAVFDPAVTTFDASACTGHALMVGRGGAETTLIGGSGHNEFWGGGAGKTTFVGNGDAEDTIWFGDGDNEAEFTGGAGANDEVFLWNVDADSIAELVSVALGDGQDVIAIGENRLSITDAGNAAITGGLSFRTRGGERFRFSDGSFHRS